MAVVGIDVEDFAYLLFGERAPVLGVIDHETFELLWCCHFDFCWYFRLAGSIIVFESQRLMV